MGPMLAVCVISAFLLTAGAAKEDIDIVIEEVDLPKDSYSSEVWSWACENEKCVKKPIEQSANNGTSEQPPISLSVCKLICPPGTLWPKPTGEVYVSPKLIPINPNSIYIKTEFSKNNAGKEGVEQSEKLMKAAGNLFSEQLRRLYKKNLKVLGRNVVITAILEDPSVHKFTEFADEGYTLNVAKTDDGIHGKITAIGFLGARHALETLLALIAFDPYTEALLIPSEVTVTDKPVYTHRGILLDTSRNFISIESIKKVLDGMAMTKLNTFHWHITDSHSFPFMSKTYPLLTKYGAYSPDKVYTAEDIVELVKYANVRGIRIIPEFDAPAHVGEGWQWVGDDAVVCFASDPWMAKCVEPPCGQLNPTSEKMYTILEGIYKDMDEVFDSDIFHMGGDEVNFNCWNTSEPVTSNMKKMGLGRSHEDFIALWTKFQSRALDILEKITGKKRKVVLWTSTLTEKGLEKNLDNSKYIIQIWTKNDDPVIKEFINHGFPVIFSNYDALYLDCGFGAWVGTGNNWCSPYIPWQKVYENDPMKLLKNLGVNATLNQVLGSEATLWTEQADDASVENRLWPRSAAMAEGLWSGEGTWQSAEQRLLHLRERMIQRQINADTVQPEWCYQNQGKCYL